MARHGNNIARALTAFVTFAALGGCLSSGGSSTNASAPGPGPSNSAPSISGSPANAVMIGSRYAFIPTTNDPDNDPLTFSIANQPLWASFDTSTGTLSGTPLLGDVGMYDQITITASDGKDSASLPGFSITVSENALGAMTVSWTAPTSNSDGSTLTDLAGFKIYYGTEQGNYTSIVDVNNPSISSYMIENLLPDTYYVVSTSVNTSGVESIYSNETVRTVN